MEWVANRLGKTKVLKYNEQSLGLNYYSSARNALASPVYDKNHPLKDSFVNIKRQKKSGFIRSWRFSRRYFISRSFFWTSSYRKFTYRR